MNKIFGTAILAVFSASSLAASFSCEKAKNDIERMICASPELSKLDEEVAQVYKKTKEDDSYDFAQNFPRQWLKSRNQCKDEACVLTAYQSRLRELQLKPIDTDDTLPATMTLARGMAIRDTAIW